MRRLCCFFYFERAAIESCASRAATPLGISSPRHITLKFRILGNAELGQILSGELCVMFNSRRLSALAPRFRTSNPVTNRERISRINAETLEGCSEIVTK